MQAHRWSLILLIISVLFSDNPALVAPLEPGHTLAPDAEPVTALPVSVGRAPAKAAAVAVLVPLQDIQQVGTVSWVLRCATMCGCIACGR